MQEKEHRRRVTFFETENKERVLAISTHFKTTRRKWIFLKTCTIDRGIFKTTLDVRLGPKYAF